MSDDTGKRRAPCLNRRYEVFDRLMFDLMAHSEENADSSEISQILLSLWNSIKEKPDGEMSTCQPLFDNLRCQQNSCHLDELPKSTSMPLSKSDSYKIVIRNGQARRICKDKLACRQLHHPSGGGRGFLQERSSETSQPLPTEPIGDLDGMPEHDTSDYGANFPSNASYHNTGQFFPSPSANKLSVTCSYCCNKRIKHRPVPETPPFLSTGTLDNALSNMRTVESLSKECCKKVYDVMSKTDQLKDRIEELEKREKAGIELMKKADNMWSHMEDYYKIKLKKIDDRQKTMKDNIDKVEAQITNYQLICQDIEAQIKKKEKSKQDSIELRLRKSNDITLMRAEIDDLKKSIENDTKAIENICKATENGAVISQKQLKKYEEKIEILKKDIANEEKKKKYVEIDGYKLIKESRKDQNQLANLLFAKTIENKELVGLQETLLKDIELLKNMKSKCKEKCKNRDQEIHDEIKAIQDAIKTFSRKCTKCNESTDTDEFRKFCSDCPRCQKKRECILNDGYCSSDPKTDCVCTTIKQRFLENVFDNMYSVLEINSHTKTSETIANAIFNSLEKSRDGKLDLETRKIVQNFILKTVKRNLNGIIVGGAVKTRCEMDPDTYNQLMLCLNEVNAPIPAKYVKSKPTKKCPRWNGPVPCQCRTGYLGTCVCEKMAPIIIDSDSPPPEVDSSKASLQHNICHHERHPTVHNCLDKKIKKASRKKSSFNKSMRAAQCMHEPELGSAEGSQFAMRLDSQESLYYTKSYTSLSNQCERRHVAIQLTSDIFKELNVSITPIPDSSNIVQPTERNVLVNNPPKNANTLKSLPNYDGFAINYVKNIENENNGDSTSSRIFRRENRNDIHFFSVGLSLEPNEPLLNNIIFLKKVSSNNYIIVLDKEYEKHFKKSIKKFIGRNNEREFDILRSESQTYFSLHKHHISGVEKALLVATRSGRVNVIVKERLTDGLIVIASVVSSNYSCNESMLRNVSSYSNLLKFYEAPVQSSCETTESDCFVSDHIYPSHQSERASMVSWLSSKRHICLEENESSGVRNESKILSDLREISNEQVLKISVYDQTKNDDDYCTINKAYISKGAATTSDDSCRNTTSICGNLEIDAKDWLTSHSALTGVLSKNYESAVLITEQVKKCMRVNDFRKNCSFKELYCNVTRNFPHSSKCNCIEDNSSSLAKSLTVVNKSINAIMSLNLLKFSENSRMSEQSNDSISTKSMNTITSQRSSAEVASNYFKCDNNPDNLKSNLVTPELRSAGDCVSFSSIQSRTLKDAIKHCNSRSSKKIEISENDTLDSSRQTRDALAQEQVSLNCVESYKSSTLKETIFNKLYHGDQTKPIPAFKFEVFPTKKSIEKCNLYKPTAELIGFSHHELCKSSTLKTAIINL